MNEGVEFFGKGYLFIFFCQLAGDLIVCCGRFVANGFVCFASWINFLWDQYFGLPCGINSGLRFWILQRFDSWFG
jgi:hypothetical protein